MTEINLLIKDGVFLFGVTIRDGERESPAWHLDFSASYLYLCLSSLPVHIRAGPACNKCRPTGLMNTLYGVGPTQSHQVSQPVTHKSPTSLHQLWRPVPSGRLVTRV